VDKATGRAVRVVPRGEAQMGMKKTPFFTEYRMKGIPPTQVPEEVVDPLIDKVLSGPEDEMFSVSEVFDYDVEMKEEDFSSFVCDRCGEMVVERYGRVVGEARVCIPCQEAMLASR